MQECSIKHIPARLQTKDRLPVEKFEVGESLYMRCKPEVLQNPYKDITITELSHNRSGSSNNILCNPDDVLYSIKEENDFEKYSGLEICILDIKSLEKGKYHKTFIEVKDGETHTGILELLHDPVPCMYPHSVFRVWLNGERVTYENNKTTLKKVNQIRNSIKEELASMIRRRQVSQKESPRTDA